MHKLVERNTSTSILMGLQYYNTEAHTVHISTTSFDGSTNYSTHGPGGVLMDRLLILGSLYKMLSTYLHLHHNDHFDDDQNPQCLSSIDVTHIAIAIGSDCDSDQNGTPFGNVVLF